MKKMKAVDSLMEKMKVGDDGNSNRTRGKIPDIYFLMHGNREKWYSIKSSSLWSSADSSSYSPTRRLKPALPPIPESIESYTFAAIGSKIYASGGLDRSTKPRKRTASSVPLYPPSDKVFYIDTLRLQEGWKAAPPMNAKRLQHYMLADAGKIYVLGGLNLHHSPDCDGKRVFAEVYDPLNSNNSWKQLARIRDDELELPQTIYGHGVVEENNDGQLNRKILFHAYYFQSLFYLNTGQQDDVGNYDVSFGRGHTSSTFLDGVFYFIDYNRIYAYDVLTSKGKRQRVVLRDVKTDTLPHLGEFMPISYLLSLGDKYLALIWAHDFYFQEFLNVHCSIIEMWKDGDSFVGQVLNCSTYSVENGRLSACMAVHTSI